MPDVREDTLSSYLDYLPAIFQEDDAGRRFLGRFLLAFEHVLTGLGDPLDPGLEEVLDGVAAGEVRRAGVERYFDPGVRPRGARTGELERAPAEFLDWLSTWVALALRADVDEELQRDLIAKSVWLYRMRGTRRGLEELIRVYTRMGVTITEFRAVFQLDVTSRLDVDTILGGGTPHYFHVRVLLPQATAAELRARRALLRAIIDAEKPAHTFYKLEIDFPTLQIEQTSTIDVDTLLD